VSLVHGHSKIHYGDKSIEINGSALVFTNPLIPFFWERVGEGHSGYVCVFTESFFNHFGAIKSYPVFQSVEVGITALNNDEVKLFNPLFLRMFNELQGNYIYKYDLMRSLLLEVVHAAQKIKPALGNLFSGSNASERIAAMFAELLERQFPVELTNQVIRLNTPAAFAEHLNVHVNHLNKALKEITGQTTSQLISSRILQEAKILLKSTNWSIAEIAWSLAFEEPNHFSSFFKTRAQLTPQKFRQAEID
jgi:AraC family transcriptional activator of pobA